MKYFVKVLNARDIIHVWENEIVQWFILLKYMTTCVERYSKKLTRNFDRRFILFTLSSSHWFVALSLRKVVTLKKVTAKQNSIFYGTRFVTNVNLLFVSVTENWICSLAIKIQGSEIYKFNSQCKLFFCEGMTKNP